MAHVVAKALIAKIDASLKAILCKKFVQKNRVCQPCIYYRKSGDPDDAHKEADLLFHHEIMNYVKKCEIPELLVKNSDQTPSGVGNS